MTKNQILGKMDNITQLISKEKIVEEVDKEIKNNTSKQGWHFDEYTEGYLDALKKIKTFLDTLEVKEVGVDLGDPKGDKSTKYIIDTKTLEVKEVDLEKEVADYIEQHNSELSGYFDIRRIARHFFALGLNSQTKDMQEALRMEYEKGRADAFAEMQKEWSEEDKDFMYDTLSNLTELKDRYGEGYGNVGKCIDWLKILKQRIGG